MIVTISKGQQVTIPASIRNELGLHIGSKVEIEQDDGVIVIKPIDADLEHLFKQAKKIKPKHELTAEQMDTVNEKLSR